MLLWTYCHGHRAGSRAIGDAGVPEKINIDGSVSNANAIEYFNIMNSTDVEIRHCKYLNNIVEQDHRWVRRKARVALGFNSFHGARATLEGVEAFRMIRKGQSRPKFARGISVAEQFHRLAA